MFDSLSIEMALRGWKVVRIIGNQRVDLCKDQTNPIITTWPSKRATRIRDGAFLLSLLRKHCPSIVIGNFHAVNWMMITSWFSRVPTRLAWYHTTLQQVNLDTNALINKLQIQRKSIVYKFASQIITNSEFSKTEVHSNFHLPLDKIAVFYNSLEDPGLHKREDFSNEKGSVIICPGRLHFIKGQDVLINALAFVVKEYPKIIVTFLGDGPEKNNLIALAEKIGVTKNCLFIGNVDHDVMLTQMSKSRLTIVPSRAEAFGLVNIESMAVSTPVIASKVGGIPEIIRDGEDGYLVPSESPEVLAERISYLLSNPEIQRTFGENARNRFLSEFELSKGIKKLADWLEVRE